MCTNYFYTKEETEELLKDKPDVIEMYKVVKVVDGRHFPLFHCWRSDYYRLGVNVAPTGEEDNRDSQGFHCFLSLQDAQGYERSLYDRFSKTATTISVYVNKEDVLFIGKSYFFPGPQDPEVAIVSKLEVRDFAKPLPF